MKNFRNQRGVAAAEAVLLLVLVAIIGFVGYYVYQTQQKVDDQNALQTAAPADVDTTPNPDSIKDINTSSDLNQAEQSLNSVDTAGDNSDLSQLENQSDSL